MNLENKVLKTSDDVVVREIQGEVIIVPITSGVGDLTDKMFSLDDTGKEIFKFLDGKAAVSDIIERLAGEYDAPAEQIKKDVLDFLSELVECNILCEV